MAVFELSLLGRFELVDRTRGPLRVPPGRLRALLGRLAFHPGRSCARGDLANLLWEGRPEAAARHSLNQALSRLRQIAGSELFLQDGERLTLNPDAITTDVDRIRALLREGSPEALGQAAELCRGDFLEGIDVDAPAFEEWLREARAEVHDLVVAVHEALVDAIPASTEPTRKARAAETLVEMDPLNALGHRALVETAMARGAVERAVRIYEAFRTRLAEELGIAPDEQLDRLVAGLRRAGAGRLSERPVADDPPPASGRPTIFIAPFRSIAEAGHGLAVANGLTHDLITELGRFRSLDVIAAESALASRDSAETLDAMCRRFGADYVLTGGLRCNATSARLNVQLLEVRGGRQLWSERYDCKLGELFDVRDDVVARIVGAVANRVEHDRMRRVRRKPTRSWAAYDYFLRALDIYYRRWSAPEAPKACKPLFEKAVELDPEFARGHAFLACVNAHMGQSERIDEDFGVSIGYARRAMAIDPLEADAPRVLGAIYLVVGHHEEGYRHLAQAVRLNPGHADLAAHMARYHGLTGAPDRALAEIARARRLNPLHPDWYWTLAALAHHAGADYPGALAALSRMRETTAMDELYAAACHAAIGEAGPARERIARALADMPGLSLESVGLYLPYKDPSMRQGLLDQFARAGLPRGASSLDQSNRAPTLIAPGGA